ncbi:MAG TPA: NAD(P)H-dependent oxidoreductase [Candidatus Levilactobacillus faecigallinarum]|uniref:NAD(P)H-dependent oxidoreductase n=1 Tax=Candidatus Levilactobacillus faecigallinarum TaxID=2838638 RepID=A0A9D1QUC8_9LACO|nr:NAD(P)H-dependent oxidoreductase [Candidatus Levilactobacillus faecigallinarum]
MKKIGLLAGSLRPESYARLLAKNLGLMTASDVLLDWLNIDDLPLFSDHLSPAAMAACTSFRQAVSGVDGLIIVTPEINHGMPGCLKNVLDIASVTEQGNSAWRNKPAVLAAVSTGDMGGISASQDLKQVALTVGMQIVQPSELYLGRAAERFDEHGLLATDHSTTDFLRSAVDQLVATLHATTDTPALAFRFTAQKLIILKDHQPVGQSELLLTDNVLTIRKVVTDPAQRGQCIGALMMVRLLAVAQLFGWSIRPTCSYARYFFEQHPEAQRLLAAE